MSAPADVAERPEARVSAPYVIAVFNQKGGVGKSLLSMGLAAVTSDTNGMAYLVDIDPQSTTAEVAARAERAGTPLPFTFEGDTDPRHLAKLRQIRGVDMVIVDCPGSLEGRDVMGQVLACADFAVIPYVHDPFVITPTRRSAALCADKGVGQVAREALKADVPAELALLQRLHRYRIDTGTDIRDQVAIAVDEWLTSQGY